MYTSVTSTIVLTIAMGKSRAGCRTSAASAPTES